MVVTPPSPSAPITAEDNGDGTYRASWTPLTLDKTSLDITLNGVRIHDSPFPVRVRFRR